MAATERRGLPRISAADWTVYLLILLLGLLQYASYPHTRDFVNDAMYPDLARSLLEKGSYQFDFSAETTLPPGFAIVLAFVGWLAGFGPATMFRVIAVCTTLGLITAYELLRKVEGRGVAAAACLLLGSSAAVFQFNTQVVFSDMPYFLVSMLVLWMALKMDRSEPGSARTGWTLLFSAALVMAVLIRSAGIALVGGLGMWMVVSRLAVPERGRVRMRMFWIPLVLGLAAQLMWSEWSQHRQKLEWQLGGWPQPYWSQLKMKNGNDPELGTAQWSDIPARVGQNMVVRSIELGKLLTGRWISRFWSSPAVLGVLLLIPLGLALSFRGGGQLYDWYFLLHEVVYLLWPWDFELRFLLPVVPLGCLYLWRGGKALWTLAQPPAQDHRLLFSDHGDSAERELGGIRGADFPVSPLRRPPVDGSVATDCGSVVLGLVGGHRMGYGQAAVHPYRPGSSLDLFYLGSRATEVAGPTPGGPCGAGRDRQPGGFAARANGVGQCALRHHQGKFLSGDRGRGLDPHA